jgi:hypothetical protein
MERRRRRRRRQELELLLTDGGGADGVADLLLPAGALGWFEQQLELGRDHQ